MSRDQLLEELPSMSLQVEEGFFLSVLSLLGFRVYDTSRSTSGEDESPPGMV